MKQLFIILALFAINSINAAEVGSGFSYQGELIDEGSPANGEYDIIFTAFEQAENGVPGLETPTFLNVQVTNGLFSIPEVDFGEAQFAGQSIWLELSVRKSSEGGNYSTLSPRQKVVATPYAVQSRYAVDAYSAFSADTATHADSADSATHADTADVAIEAQSLAAGNANMADVLQFDGLDWIPVPMEQINESPWGQSNGDVYRTDGEVGIGTAAPGATLHVHSNDSFELARYDGGSRTFNTYFEEGASRGYIGSYQEGLIGTSDADFDLGTSATNSTGSLHLTTKAVPRVTIDDEGLTGVNVTVPLARLHVDGDTNESPLRVRYNGQTKLWVKDNGNTHVYTQLVSEGQTNLKGVTTANQDIKQDFDHHGAVKYMVKFVCDDQNSSITSQVNNTNTPGTVTISAASGYCKLTFPTNVEDRYFIGSSDTPFAIVNGSCGQALNNTLKCGVFNMITQSSEQTLLDMVLIVY